DFLSFEAPKKGRGLLLGHTLATIVPSPRWGEGQGEGPPRERPSKHTHPSGATRTVLPLSFLVALPNRKSATHFSWQRSRSSRPGEASASCGSPRMMEASASPVVFSG